MHYRRAAPAALLCLLLVWPALAYAAGMGAVPVAASDWSDYPPAVRHLERVASWQGVNIERILALKLDLVLGWRGGNPQVIIAKRLNFDYTIWTENKISVLQPLSLFLLVLIYAQLG